MARYNLDGEEIVVRILFTPSFFEEDGSLSPAAFHLHDLDKGPEKDISVLRKVCSTYQEKHDEIARKPRNPHDTYCGDAVFKVQDIRDIKIPSNNQTGVIVSSSSRTNVHASVYFIINNNIIDSVRSRNSIEFMLFASKLASIAKVKIVI